MSDYNLMDVQSSLLNQNYVYYTSLARYKPSLYKAVAKKNLEVANSLNNVLNLDQEKGAKIRNMAEAELAKEISALRHKFQINISAPEAKEILKRPDFYNELINAINSNLNLEQIYQRNIMLIQDSVADDKRKGGQKNLVTYFPTFLEQEIKEQLKAGGLLSQENIMQYLTDVDNLSQAVEKTLDNVMPDIVNRALIRMFRKRGIESGIKNISDKKRKQYMSAYKEIFNELNKYKNNAEKSPILKEIYQIYQIDNLKNDISDYILKINSQLTRKETNILNKNFRGKLQTRVDSRGGLTSEVIYNLISNIKIKDAKILGGSAHSGGPGFKADTISTIGVDISPVLDMLNNLQTTGDLSEEASLRVKNMKRLKELHERLKQSSDGTGFVVYTNIKNQKYGKNAEGFSGGKPLTMEYFERLMEGVGWNSNFNTIVGMILQLSDGAVGNNLLNKQDFQILFARYVAFLLFDDVDQIGVENASSINALHLLNLNGVLIPISLVLFSLADAIDEVNTNEIQRLVKITLTTPKEVYFYYGENDRYGQVNEVEWLNGRPPIVAWEEQRNYALKNTKIQAKFLKNFQEIIQTYIASSQWRS